MILRFQHLRSKAARVLRAGRREAARSGRPIARIHLELAANYKRLADLDRLTRAQLMRAG